MLKTALVLFAHGSRDPAWAAPLERIRGVIQKKAPGLRVELAFLELMKPDLRECAELLVAEGHRRISILPMFIAQGGHLRRDVPQLIDDLCLRYPQVRFDLSAAVGEADSVIQAMAEHALALTG